MGNRYRKRLETWLHVFESLQRFGDAGELLAFIRNVGMSLTTISEISEICQDYDFWAWELYVIMTDPQYHDGENGAIIVYGSNPAGLATPKQSSQNVNAEISTSADYNKYFSCLNEMNAEPLSIFVKLTGENGQPIKIGRASCRERV